MSSTLGRQILGNQTQAMEEATEAVAGSNFLRTNPTFNPAVFEGIDASGAVQGADLSPAIGTGIDYKQLSQEGALNSKQMDAYKAELEAKYGNKYAGMEKQQPLSPEAQASLYRSYVPPQADPNKKLISSNLTGGFSSGSSANQFHVPKDLTETLEKLYAGLEETAQEQLGSLETRDFTEDIQDLVDSGRISAEQLNELQQQNLVDAEGRAIDKIGIIEAELLDKLTSQEEDRMRIQQALADESAMRTGEFRSAARDRVASARRELGPLVSSEFDEVAEMTGALTEAQAASDAASASRLRQVAQMAAAERMAAPAQLAAEAKMAVGDEKFRMENQLRVQLAQNIAQLDTSEREMLLQEAMRQENFGIQRDQALANAMFSLAQQRNQALLQEQMRLDTVQQRQSEILQQQGFQRRMAQEARAASAAASAANKKELEAMKLERDRYLFETLSNDKNSNEFGMTQEEFDSKPEGWKQAQYEALVGYEVAAEFGPFPEQETPNTMGYGTTWFADNFGTTAGSYQWKRMYNQLGEAAFNVMMADNYDSESPDAFDAMVAVRDKIMGERDAMYDSGGEIMANFHFMVDNILTKTPAMLAEEFGFRFDNREEDEEE